MAVIKGPGWNQWEVITHLIPCWECWCWGIWNTAQTWAFSLRGSVVWPLSLIHFTWEQFIIYFSLYTVYTSGNFGNCGLQILFLLFLLRPFLQAYEVRTTTDPVMRQNVTETCFPIHPVQFWSVGISFVDIGLVLKILALTSLGNTSAHYRVCGRSDFICLLQTRS